MKKQYEYESDWGPYVFPESSSHFASEEELRETFSTVDLTVLPFTAAGIPLAVSADGRTAVVNDETENTLIYGETGSKKTRCCVRPLLTTLIGKGESMIVTDPKGELATDPRLRGFLDERGYDTVFLDFRSFRGDCCNIFQQALALYRAGKEAMAVENAANVIHALVEKTSSQKSDPFWAITSEELIIPVVHILLDMFARRHPEYVNMASVANFVTEEGVEMLSSWLDSILSDSLCPSVSMLRGALSGSEKTTANVVVSAYTALQPFLVNEGLMNMLSCSSFDPGKLYEKPTCVFLIVPDEKSTYDRIAGILMDNFYARLVDTFGETYQNRRAPACRVNFVCDEFCNIRINDMGPKISACRSREIRFFLVCQSLSQLEARYGDFAPVIVGNCKNVLFLKSSDINLIRYITEICGTTNVSADGSPQPLVSVSMLRDLKKERDFKEAVFIRDDLVYRAVLPDYETYDILSRYASGEPAAIPERARKAEVMTLRNVRGGLITGGYHPPFQNRNGR